MLFALAACDLYFGTPPTPTPTAAPEPIPHLIVAWATASGDLFAWREDDPTPRQIASGSAITPYLAPDGQHVAFTRGAEGNPVSLWVVGIDGRGARERVAPDSLPANRGRTEIAQVAWLDDHTVYFNTSQRTDSGVVNDDNLYRVELDGDAQLILPSGAGGSFAISPDGQSIAVVKAGIYDTEKGSVSVLDPLGARVREGLTFTAINTPDQPPFYPPLSWSADGAFVRVPIPDHDGSRVTLWRVPVASPDGDARIFGYVTAARAGLPVWSDSKMLYLQATPAGADLLIADANGENPQRYASGAISDARWLPDGAHFAYFADGSLWVGQRGQDRLRLVSASPDQVKFAGDWAVYATATDLRAIRIDGSASVLISAEAASAFDAASTADTNGDSP